MSVTVGNVKGGVGKTTLAVNLAIALSRQGRDVLLIDGDEQGTAIAFTELRGAQKDGRPVIQPSLSMELRSEARFASSPPNIPTL